MVKIMIIRAVKKSHIWAPLKKPSIVHILHDLAGRVLLVKVSLECFPCVRIFLGMKYCPAVQLHRTITEQDALGCSKNVPEVRTMERE
jgi:hypothetical protein